MIPKDPPSLIKICELEEYYPTRTEMGLLKESALEIANIVEGHHLIEFGSGSSTKIRILLDAATDLASYIPVDISKDHLYASAESIAQDYPDLDVIPVCADFTRTFDLPEKAEDGNKVGFFPRLNYWQFFPPGSIGFPVHDNAFVRR